MPSLQLFSRQGCHLCEVLLEQLLPLVRGTFNVEVHDIDLRQEWREAYGTRIPVVEYNGRAICQYRLDRDAVIKLVNQVRSAGAE